MVDRSHAFKAGLFVLGLSAALAVVAFAVQGDSPERVPYVVVSQGSVSGLSAQSAITYRGVPAGVVTSIAIDPEDHRNVLVRIQVNRTIPVTRGTYARLQTQLVTGQASLTLKDDFKDPKPLPTSEEHPAHIKLQSSLVQQAEEVLPKVLDRLDAVTRRVDRVLEGVDRAKLGQTMQRVAGFTERLPRIGRKLERALDTVPRVGRDASKLLARVDRTVGSLKRSLGQVVDEAKEIGAAGRNVTRELSQRTLPRANRALEGITRTAYEVRRLAAEIRDSPQTLVMGASRPRPGPGERAAANGDGS